jgi:hypothetical protein
LLAHTKQTEECLDLLFSSPAKPTINAVGIVFRQPAQFSTNARFSFAEKVLGNSFYPQSACVE